MSRFFARFRFDARRSRGRGQALVLFALFLLVLLGASALAIDYANWLLTDRRLQNVSDHAALAGASAFQQRLSQGQCAASPGTAQCAEARLQAWTSLNAELGPSAGSPAPIGIDVTTLACLSSKDTPATGWTHTGAGTKGADCTADISFGGRTLWVTTPPPNNASYTGIGGRYALNYAVVFVRVDEPTSSFFGRALGIAARDRRGWSTAGPLPTDFALQVFCRNGLLPQHGACGGSGATSLVIDGQGGIHLVRGDVGSNESAKVTASNGRGIVTEAGNVFVVEGSCSYSLWRCPNGPPSLGGISDGYNGKNAFLMPPQPVPHYASPITAGTVSDPNCVGANATDGCVPYRGAPAELPSSPGTWECTTNPVEVTATKPLCGRPHDYNSATGPPVNGTIRCDAIQPQDDGYLTSALHHDMHPVEDTANPSKKFQGPGNKDIFQYLADFATPKVADTIPTDGVYTKAGDSGTYRTWLGYGSSVASVGKGTLGDPDPGTLYLRWVPYRTTGTTGTPDTGGVAGNLVTISVELDELIAGTWTPVAGGSDSVTFSSGTTGALPVREVAIDRINVGQFNQLSLNFTVTTSGPKANARGGGISWAELETTHLSPFQPPRIPPGYYHQIHIPQDGCAILDPTAATFTSATTGLKLYQLPGIYRFDWQSSNAPAIQLDAGGAGTPGGFLIGDGVTLVFDPFSPPNSGEAIDVGPDAGLVLNTMKVAGSTPPCTPTEPETSTYNPSSIDATDPNAPLSLLPYSAVCAAWTVDITSQAGVHAGQLAWPMCTDPTQLTCSIDRARYEESPAPASYRGITFYFTPAQTMPNGDWPATAIGGRFEMGGGAGDQPGISFRGVLYAPYDDVKISSSNGFNTVGQVLAWTAKFNGGDSYIELDYPYEGEPAPPYLLEPGVGQ